MSNIHIMLGGNFDNIPSNWLEATYGEEWIGVDRGALYLINHNINPIVSVGDFDSVTEEEFLLIEQHSEKISKVPSEKDMTDTELSIQIAIGMEKHHNIIVCAATGTRLDHMINTFSIPIQDQFRPYAEKIKFIDKTNTVSYYLPGEHCIKRDKSKQYISFGAMIAVDNLTLGRGLKYTLDNVNVPHPYMYASNEFNEEEACFSFQKGLVMVIQSKD